MMKFLDGNKTYLVALAAILSALTSYLMDTATVAEAIQIALIGGVAATLRHAIAKATGSTVIADAVVDAVENAVDKAASK